MAQIMSSCLFFLLLLFVCCAKFRFKLKKLGLENPMDGGAWWAAVHVVAKSRTRLSNFAITFHCPALEKAMAAHSSVLAWRISGMGKPRGLPSLGSHGIGHD